MTLPLLVVGTASAESYEAKIYGIPEGLHLMSISGAGDNGMMTGYTAVGATFERAAYRTPQGLRDLHPAGFARSQISDSWGSTYHAGFGELASGPSRALFWVGAGAAVNLHPAGATYVSSQAFGVGGQIQVGIFRSTQACPTCGADANKAHPAIWSRTAASFGRLHVPVGNEDGVALSTDGTQHAGFSTRRSDNLAHAMLWTGPNSVTDLHPAGFEESQANSNWGSQQGGFVQGVATNERRNAALWSSTAQSFVSLHPASTFRQSEVLAIRGTLQVGTANALNTPNRFQAIAWHGSAATWINLHFRLPSQFWLWHSAAMDIDNLGNITGYVEHPTTGSRRPVIWERLP